MPMLQDSTTRLPSRVFHFTIDQLEHLASDGDHRGTIGEVVHEDDELVPAPTRYRVVRRTAAAVSRFGDDPQPHRRRIGGRGCR